MFEVNAATVDAGVKGLGHFLNIRRADNAAVTGIAFDADAKPF